MNLGAKAAVAGVATLMLMATAAMGQQSLASQYNFFTFDYPGSIDYPDSTFPLGINNHREIVGFYTDGMGVEHGYLWKNGTFLSIDYPGAPLVPFGGSAAAGINNRGDIVGTWIDKNGFEHGYLRAVPLFCGDDDDTDTGGPCKPVFSSIDVPGAAQTTGIEFEFGTGLGTAAVGIDDDGLISGVYATHGLYSNGFTVLHGVFATTDAPGASHMQGNGTKFFEDANGGLVTGDYLTQLNAQTEPVSHAFLDDQGKLITIDVPGSEKGGFGTQANGVNSAKDVVGVFSDAAGTFHGFLWRTGNYFTLDFPKMPYNEVHAINDIGDVTGGYATDAAAVHTHGFIAFRKVPPVATPVR